MRLTELDEYQVARAYRYPTEGGQWVRAGFVSSIDGAATVDGVSGPLGTPADGRVFRLLRELAEVVVVGAGTVRSEEYGAVNTDPDRRRRLAHWGFGGDAEGRAPILAILSAGLALDPAARWCAEASEPPLVFTTLDAPEERKRRLRDAGVRVRELSTDRVPVEALIAELRTSGLRRILCEGGPRLFADLLAAELIDEVCLTTSPVLVGGTGTRITHCQNSFHRSMRLEQIITGDDGTLLTRWTRSPHAA